MSRSGSGQGRAFRRRSCESKTRYATETEAFAAARHLRLTKGYPGGYYACPYCSGFHIGRPDKRKRRSIAAKRRAAQ